MDHETISVLKTVCAAGGARDGYNGEANARLELLVEAGLLDVAEHSTPDANTKTRRRRFYKPTKKGVNLIETAKAHGAA